MTEAEWLVTEDAGEMYWWVCPYRSKYNESLPKITRRLGSLYALACIHATLQAKSQPFLVQSVEAVERAVEVGDWAEVDRLGQEALRRCGEVVDTAGLDTVPHFWALAALRLTGSDIDQYARHVPFFLLKALGRSRKVPQLRKTYADLLRDIAGNPFRGSRGRQFNKRKRKPQLEPIFRPEWRTDTVLALTRGMYESREFSAMPILADALQDAGCEQPDILNHCRDLNATHVRGCWVVDLVLEKT
jgi:hypothetical protein